MVTFRMERSDIISVSTDEMIRKKCSFSNSLVTSIDVTTSFRDIEQYAKRSDSATATNATTVDRTEPYSERFVEDAGCFEALDP